MNLKLNTCRLALLFIGLLSNIGLEGQTSDRLIAMQKQIDSLVLNGIDSSAFPGAQVLVVFKGEKLFHKTYGYHTYENKTKVQKEDLYDMASVTKVSTGLPILMKLWGEGRFDLDAPLSQYLPEFKKSNKGNLSYREMLSHQAGLKPYIVYWQNTLKKNGKFKSRTFKKEMSKKYPIEITNSLFLHKKYKQKMYKEIFNSDLELKKEYKYSGLLFQLLPRIVENITQEAFQAYLYKEIFEPINVKTLVYNPLIDFPRKRIVPTEMDTFWRKGLVQGTVHDEAAAMLGGISCNAGLFGTTEDLAKLFQMYVQKGFYNGNRILKETAVDEFTKRHFVADGNRRALGFDKPPLKYVFGDSYIAESASQESFGHSGFTGTFVWADPKAEIVFVFMSNRVYPDRSYRNLYNMNIRPMLHQAVYDALVD